MTDAMSRFIAAESARLRAVGIPEARIAWLLGTEPANANQPLVPRMHGKLRGVLSTRIVALLAGGSRTVKQIAEHCGRLPRDMRPVLRAMRQRGHVVSRQSIDGLEYLLP